MSEPIGVRCMLMRGGTSKGAYFLGTDLPDDPAARDDLLLRLLGSPDNRQVDGIGGGHPLTSKVAVVSTSDAEDSDVDYLFLQVHVDRALVSAGQPCGNILAGIAPFALERGLVAPGQDTTTVRIRMVNTRRIAIATIATPGGRVAYTGRTLISGVPFPAAPVTIRFTGTEGSVCGRLLPTGRAHDDVDGLAVTCIDNGMPVGIVAAKAFGISGYESCAELEADTGVRERLERLRLRVGKLMGLGDVADQTVPKMTLVAAPRDGGTVCTRTFIPHRCHTSIGVLGAVTVASAVMLSGSVAAEVADPVPPDGTVRLEHPTGFFDTRLGEDGVAVVRTARKLFDGVAWPRPAG
ncbi:MAG TPA: 4-oxalomesaconate tautomerase [Micromonosporaceae bacterium]|jgi:4-oxalomesaconate tautomerase|nr:4-oxalomesaconate tautomerase [Micromonosporaceae bacterium]